MTPERKAELAKRYRQAVLNADADATQDAWMRYLAALWEEDGDLQIFLELREVPRDNGARIDRQLLARKLTKRQVFGEIREHCADVYASSLNRYKIAEIDIASETYLGITKDLALEVLKAFESVNGRDEFAVCSAMARTWHRFVERLHAQYGLPTVQVMRGKLKPRSEAEKTLLDGGDFETRMTPQERADLEAEVE